MKFSSVLKLAGTIASVVAAYKVGAYLGTTELMGSMCLVEMTIEDGASKATKGVIKTTEPKEVAKSINDIHSISDFFNVAQRGALGLYLSKMTGADLSFIQDFRNAMNEMSNETEVTDNADDSE